MSNSWAKKCEGQTTKCTSDCVKTFDISGSISISESCSGGCCQKVIQASDGVGSNDNEQVQRVGDSCYRDSCGNFQGYCGDIPQVCSCSSDSNCCECKRDRECKKCKRKPTYKKEKYPKRCYEDSDPDYYYESDTDYDDYYECTDYDSYDYDDYYDCDRKCPCDDFYRGSCATKELDTVAEED